MDIIVRETNREASRVYNEWNLARCANGCMCNFQMKRNVPQGRGLHLEGLAISKGLGQISRVRAGFEPTTPCFVVKHLANVLSPQPF